MILLPISHHRFSTSSVSVCFKLQVLHKSRELVCLFFDRKWQMNVKKKHDNFHFHYKNYQMLNVRFHERFFFLHNCLLGVKPDGATWSVKWFERSNAFLKTKTFHHSLVFEMELIWFQRWFQHYFHSNRNEQCGKE